MDSREKKNGAIWLLSLEEKKTEGEVIMSGRWREEKGGVQQQGEREENKD